VRRSNAHLLARPGFPPARVGDPGLRRRHPRLGPPGRRRTFHVKKRGWPAASRTGCGATNPANMQSASLFKLSFGRPNRPQPGGGGESGSRQGPAPVNGTPRISGVIARRGVQASVTSALDSLSQQSRYTPDVPLALLDAPRYDRALHATGHVGRSRGGGDAGSPGGGASYALAATSASSRSDRPA
jgi:hypothetical protein